MKSGRNDPCPCGSGKKYKRCCGTYGVSGYSLPVPARSEHETEGNRAVPAPSSSTRESPRLEEEARRIFQQGNALAAQGRMEQAVAHYERSLSLKEDAEIRNNLGNALAAQGRMEQAAVQYERALSLTPGHALAHSNLGNILMHNGRLSEAIVHFQRAIALKPDFAQAHNNLGLAYQSQGEIEQALAQYQRALSLRSDYIDAHGNLLMVLNYVASADPASVYTAHLDFARRWEAPLAAQRQPHPNDRSSERRLKIGYVSSDFRQHSVAHFIEPVLENHDRERFEIYCYSNHFQEDDMTARLKKWANHWRRIAGIPDEAVAKQIRADRIDILVDLNGHTANNRLLMFARKPAPVQITWLGYPNTTGLTAMDYRITDGHADPVGMTEHLHSEKLMRLPECFSCYRPPREAPEISELPARKNGCITFGSFNHQAKISPAVMAAWAGILQAIPGSRLVIKNPGLGDAPTQQAVRGRFMTLGITSERLELLGLDRSPEVHLKRYQDIDIGLDPFPYNGTTTTCEALWMGVPVVTLAGRSHAGRVGVSQMSNLDMPELVCQTTEEYIAIAVRLANDLERLGQLRKELRPRMAASPLTDARRFTKNLEQAYLAMWKNQVS